MMLILVLAALSSIAAPKSDLLAVRSLQHRVSYIGMDYPDAVEKGIIRNESEYQEQLEVIERTLASVLKSELAVLQPDLLKLRSLILSKADAREVSGLAREIELRIARHWALPTAPSEATAASGQKVFLANCAACHGTSARGDGPAAANMDPRPANLRSPERMSRATPSFIFNTIRLGIEDTAMPSFPLLSDLEIWDLAAYVLSSK